MAFLFITENFYLFVVLYEALKSITDFRSYLFTNSKLKQPEIDDYGIDFYAFGDRIA